MARGSCCLNVLNAIYLVLSLGLACASIWFFVQVFEFTSLRNANHYLLDYRVYWPQIIPWIFFFVALFAVSIACVGFVGCKKDSKRLLVIYGIFQTVVVLLFIASAVIALVCADSIATDNFVKDTVWDVYFQSKQDNDVAAAFGSIEKKLQCCGADSPRDYKNWKNEFPRSCCDVFYHGFYGSYIIDCDFTNKLANERHGCATVATEYAKIVTRVFSGVSIFLALIGIMSVFVAFSLSRSTKQKPRQPNESESKKVLL